MRSDIDKGEIKMRRNKLGLIRMSLAVMIAAMILMLFSGCSSGSKSDDSAMAPAPEPAAGVSEASIMDKTTSVQFSEAAPAASAEVSSAPEQPAEDSLQGSGNTSAGTDVSGSFGGGIGTIADANAGFDRKVIYRANLVMKVDTFASAEEELLNLIHLGGAYVLQFADSHNADEIGATYVIKVPSDGFSSFLEKLQKIKNVKFDREVTGNDVTEEFVDLDSRLKAKQVVEARLISFMDKATKTDDLVRFSDALAQVQQEIEQLKGRIRFLQQNVAFSTINLRLYQATVVKEVVEEKKVEEKPGFSERISDALSGSTRVLREFGEGLLVVVAAIFPILIVVGAIGLPTFYFVRRSRLTKRAISEEKRKAWNNTLVNREEAASEPEPKDGGR
jgi:hypothetical protein